MHSAKLTMTKFLPVLFLACGLQLGANAQENSPYSRYGLGDIVPNHNIVSRAMGGISAGLGPNPYQPEIQSINFTNPASLSTLYNTVFEVSAEADVRTLKSTNPPKKFTQTNSLFSYLQLGFPLTTRKMAKKDISWGMSFGIRPVTRIDYKIEKSERLTAIDSLHTLYEGTGGVNQAFLGTGIRYHNLSFGIIAGYMFGSKDYSTKVEFVNDSISYYRANYSDKTTFGGIFINVGVQYVYKLNSGILRFGAYGGLQQKLKANRDDLTETFSYDAVGSTYRIDSVYEQKDIEGRIKYPSTVGIGFTFTGNHWLYGVDVETSNWSNYTYYGKTDQVQNNFTIRAGAEYSPLKLGTTVKKYFNFVKYRAGAYYGSDYIMVNKSRPEYGVTIGAGFPLTTLQRINLYTAGTAVLNIGVEFANRGNKQTNIRENTMRYSIGISMNARWFQKPKYN